MKFGQPCLLFTIAILFMSFGVQPVLAIPFPEEANRAAWDRGCADWPVSIPMAAQGKSERNPSIHIEKADGVFRVFVKMIFDAERGESYAQLYESLQKLVFDGGPYPQWVLPGINENPMGNRYFVSVDGLVVTEKEAEKHFALTGPYTFKVLWFERAGVTTMEMRRDLEPAPRCDLFAKFEAAPIEKITYRMTPREDLIHLLMGELYLIPYLQQRKIELRFRLVTKPAMIVYQMMPEAMMRTEVEVRGRRIFENLIELRRTYRVAKAPIVDGAAPLKEAPRKKKKR